MNLRQRRTQVRIATLSAAVILTVLTFARIITGTTLVAETPEGTISAINMIYNASPYITPAAWVAFLLALFWKGSIRALWRQRGYDYDTFRVLARMRGSDTRIRILMSLSVPKYRSQIADELGLDWRAIDAHINMLVQHKLVEEIVSVGMAKYLVITDRGKQVLELRKNGKYHC